MKAFFKKKFIIWIIGVIIVAIAVGCTSLISSKKSKNNNIGSQVNIAKIEKVSKEPPTSELVNSNDQAKSIQTNSTDVNKEVNNNAIEPIIEVTVSNVDELIDAIGSNKHIKLRKGIYNVSKIKEMISKNKKFNYVYENGYDTAILKQGVNYVDISDGKELAVNGINNLTLEGLGDEYVEIVADPRDAYIFRFNNSNNIALKNLKIGHTIKDEMFICNAGVIKVINSQNFNIYNCLLYGCGTIGFIRIM